MLGCFTDGYIDSLLQFSVDEDGKPIYAVDWTDDSFSPSSLEIIRKECKAFYVSNVEDLTEFCAQSEKFLSSGEEPLDFDKEELWMIAGSDLLWTRNRNIVDGVMVGFLSREGVDHKLKYRLHEKARTLGKRLASMGDDGKISVSAHYKWGCK